MGDGTDEQLARMRRAMGKLLREGRQREFDAVAAAYAALKREGMERAEEEHRETVRARRAARGAERPSVEPRRWRLPRGFGVSPLAQQRAREGVRDVSVVPVGRRALQPWRRGAPMSEQIWRP